MQIQNNSKIKIQDLFVHQIEDRFTYFHTSNQIISSPNTVFHFFQNFSQYDIQHQQKVLNSIIRSIKSVSTNAYFLNQHGSQNSMRIIKILITLITQNVKNYLLFNLLLQVFQLLLPSSSLEQEIIRPATQKIVQNLYDQQIDVEHIFGTINITKALYAAKIDADKQPKNLLIFHGSKGLQLLQNDTNNNLGWKFQQGMTLMFWIYIENIKFGTQNNLPKIFTFYSPNKGGVEAYMIDNKVFYRILGSKYSQPQIGSNGINLGEIQPKKWNFICFQHQGSKVFMKSKLNFYINKNKPSTFSIDPPKISKNADTKFIFFDNFYGKTSSIALFTHPIGNQQIQQYNKNINSMQNVKKTKAYLFELHQGKLYERSGFGFSPNFILQRDQKMDFNNILPFFYILKFIPEGQTYPILNEVLSLIVLFLRKSSKNQNTAFLEEYLKISAILISRANEKVYDENSIKSILHIKHTITDAQLLDQYFGDFLWSIVGGNAEMQRKQQIIQIIKNGFMQNIGHYREVIGFDQMLNYLIKMEPKTISCCEKHYNLVAKRIQSSFCFQSYSKAYRTTINYILQLIQLYFQNPNINFAQQCYKLCRLLTLKFSPCFIMDFLSLIKKIITQKLNQKISQSQTKKIMKYFKEKKIYSIFLHVIQNNFFAQIKAEAVKMIYQVFLFKKGQQKDQVEISLEISKALWKINQQKKSTNDSPLKKSKKQVQSDQQDTFKKPEKQQIQEYKADKFFVNKHKAFNKIDIQEVQQEKQYKEVGPMAPQLRNRDKGNKKFDFNFVNANKKQTPKLKIEEKAQNIEPQNNLNLQSMSGQMLNNVVSMDVPKKKGKKQFGLSINTDQINEMYTFGGEKGQQIIVSEQQQKSELEKIRKLAKICVKAMRKGRGQQVSDEEEEKDEQLESKTEERRVMMPPPTTTTNKTLQQRKKKVLNLNFISQEQDEEEQQHKNGHVSKGSHRQLDSHASHPQVGQNQQIGSHGLLQIEDAQETNKAESQTKTFKKPENKKKPSIGLNFQAIKQQTPSNHSQSVKESSLIRSSKKYSFSKSPSNISPSSNKSSSSSENNLLSLYSSLLQCLLNMSFQTSLIQNSLIQTPSVLCIFFKWIPQTQLQIKFLNDLDIITDQPTNLEKIIQIPELYDFLFELCYKCIVLEEMGQKKIYIQKLQNFIKKVYSYIFRQDPAGHSKLNYIIDWSNDKKNEYHPKSLLLTSRYAVVLILQSFQQILLMNKTNSDKIRQRNFQSMGCLLQALLKYIPAPSQQEFYLDQSQRVFLANQQEMMPSLAPYFRSKWLDQTACRKYYYLFKKFFSTQWYNKGFIKLQNGETNFVQIGLNALQRESSYFLRDNFLVSLIQITRSLFRNQTSSSVTYKQLSHQIIWQIVVLIILSETTKEKTVKNHKSQRILCFLKNCKFLADQQIQKVMNIIPILSTTKHFLGILRMNSKDDKSNTPIILGDGVLDQIITSYIPQQLLRLDRGYDIQSFKLHFSNVWIPSQNHYKKLHSEVFLKEKQRNKKVEDKSLNFIETISNLMEQQNQRYLYLQTLVQADRRKSLNKYRKIWDNLRLFGSIWHIPQLILQIDTLFNKSLYSYEKYQPCDYYKYKISKHQSKAKTRYLLKPRLNQNKFSELELTEQIKQQKNQIYLNKAILYSIQNLSIGKSKISWLYDKENIKQLQITFSFKKVHLINTLTIRNGHLAIINDKLIFTASFIHEKTNHLAITQYQLRKNKSLFKVWPLQYIKDVLRRRYVNRKRAVQITFIHGKSILFEFLDQNDLEDFFKKLTRFKGTKCPNLSFISKTTDVKKIFQNYGYFGKWNNYEMSNFQYIMELNNISGRSYADTTQYPVMPWVLINFNSQKLALSQQLNYRNLQLPMGALGSPQRAANFEERYQLLTVDDKKQRKFHYGTHYSSPGIVYHFLIRLYPFTQGAILLQSGKFDFADRLFFSISDSYKNATTQHSDVRQLLPELYTIPEVYLNINKQDFGLMQSKKRVNNIELPQWARQNPYLYVTKIKKAFEQAKVSQSIHNWIDLIFGFKQRGEEAVKNLNCFFYLTYEDSVDWQDIQNQKQIYALESQIMNFGQTPSQVFVKPHPQRNNLYTLKAYNYVCDPEAVIKVYRPSKNTNLLQEQVELNPLKQQNTSIIHMKWVKDDKLVFIRRNGQMLFYKLHPPSNLSATKVPFQCAIQKQKKIEKMEYTQLENHFNFDPSLKVVSFPIQFINKGNVICLGGLLDGRLILLDVETQNIIQTYTVHEHTISCIKADAKDNFLITGDVKGHVIIWRLINSHNSVKLTVYQSLHDQKKQITSIFFSYQLRSFAVSSMDGSVFVYNNITSKKVRVYYHPNKLPINDIIISTNPLASVVLFSNQQGLIYCYSINGQLIQRVHQKQSQCFLAATLLKDSLGFEYLTYGNEKGQTIIRSMPYLDSPNKLNVAKSAVVNRICPSRNGKFLVTGCSDGELSIITDPNSISK